MGLLWLRTGSRGFTRGMAVGWGDGADVHGPLCGWEVRADAAEGVLSGHHLSSLVHHCGTKCGQKKINNSLSYMLENVIPNRQQFEWVDNVVEDRNLTPNQKVIFNAGTSYLSSYGIWKSESLLQSESTGSTLALLSFVRIFSASRFIHSLFIFLPAIILVMVWQKWWGQKKKKKMTWK